MNGGIPNVATPMIQNPNFGMQPPQNQVQNQLPNQPQSHQQVINGLPTGPIPQGQMLPQNQRMQQQFINQSPNMQFPQQLGGMNPQYVPHQQLAQGGLRPGVQRATTMQMGAGPNAAVKTPNQMTFGMQPPNLAPLPGSAGSNSAANSQGHTPQMGNQPAPNPAQFQPVPKQFVQTPQLGIPQGQPALAPGAQRPWLAVGPAPPQAPGKPVVVGNGSFRQDQFPNELNIKIFKRNLGNALVVRVLDIIEQISSESRANLITVEYWTRVVQLYFMPTSTLRLNFAPSDNNTENYDFGGSYLKPYELNSVTAPRFFSQVMKSDSFSSCNLSLPGVKFQVMNNGAIFIASRVLVTYFFADGSLSNVTGGCKILMNRDFRIEWIDCRLMNYHSSISLTNLDKIWNSVTRKNDHNEFKQELILKIKDDSLSFKLSQTSGLDAYLMRIMQIGDVMSNLKSLMGFSMVNNVKLPIKALELFMTANNNYQSQIMKQRQAQRQPQQFQPQPQPQQQPQRPPVKLAKNGNSPSLAPDDDKLKKRRISAVSAAGLPLNPDEPKRRK